MGLREILNGDRMTAGRCPVGTRVLIADFLPVIGHPMEVTVREWSAGGRVKLEHASGAVSWHERPPIVVEVLRVPNSEYHVSDRQGLAQPLSETVPWPTNS